MLNSLFLHVPLHHHTIRHRAHWQWRKVVLNSLLLKLTAVLPPELLSGRTLRLAELNSLLLHLPQLNISHLSKWLRTALL
jgi:hypothetical protein